MPKKTIKVKVIKEDETHDELTEKKVAEIKETFEKGYSQMVKSVKTFKKGFSQLFKEAERRSENS